MGVFGTYSVKELGIIVQAPWECESKVNSITSFSISKSERALYSAIVFKEIEALGRKTSPLTLAWDNSVHGH